MPPVSIKAGKFIRRSTEAEAQSNIWIEQLQTVLIDFLLLGCNNIDFMNALGIVLEGVGS
jgi:hypothetical protein